MSRRPPSMCNALGRRERMRFDSPAARITAVRPLIIASRLARPVPPLRPQSRAPWGSQHRSLQPITPQSSADPAKQVPPNLSPLSKPCQGRRFHFAPEHHRNRPPLYDRLLKHPRPQKAEEFATNSSPSELP